MQTMLTLETDFNGLVTGLHSTLEAMARTDRFRIAMTEENAADGEMARLTEAKIVRQWRFASDLRNGLIEAGGDMPHFDKLMWDSWYRIQQGSGQKAWKTAFEPMEDIAGALGLPHPRLKAEVMQQ